MMTSGSNVYSRICVEMTVTFITLQHVIYALADPYRYDGQWRLLLSVSVCVSVH